MSEHQAIADHADIAALRGAFTDASMMPHISEDLVSRAAIRAGVERPRALWEYFVRTVNTNEQTHA